MAFDFNTFMTRVHQDNPHFKRIIKTSHLDPIINELKDKKFFTPALKAKLQELVAFLPHAEQLKYTRALGYLTAELGVPVVAIPCKPVMKFVEFSIYTGSYLVPAQNKMVPLDPSVPGSIGPRSYVHTHRLSWESSNGNPASLANVLTREYVKFLADTQAPPFNNIQDPDREFYMPQGGTRGGTFNDDDHSTKLPCLILCEPRQTGTLIAEQRYQYSIDNGATWVNMPGGEFLLEKTVRQEGNDWVFVFKKTNWPLHNKKRFHFEVHYTVGPRPLLMPGNDKHVAKGNTVRANIKHYARKVVSLG